MTPPNLNIPYGYCKCGCGGKTTISKINRYDRGVFQGQPTNRLRGHAKSNNFIAEDRYESKEMGYSTPCWIWKECINSAGYGRISRRFKSTRKFKSTLAHVAMYEQIIGPVPTGMELDHLCRIPRCVNPHHLDPVSHAINMRRGKNTKLTLDKAKQIRSLIHEMTYNSLAEMFEVSDSTIWAIVTNRRWLE